MAHLTRTKEGLMSNLYWLNEAQMERLLPDFSMRHGVPHVEDQRVLSGIILINSNDLRRRDAPAAYGPTSPPTTAEKPLQLKPKGLFISHQPSAIAASVIFWS